MRRLEELASPPVREMPEFKDPFKVPGTALTYKISKRLEKIALPKEPPEIIPPRVLGTVSRGALQAIGTAFFPFFPFFPPSSANLPLSTGPVATPARISRPQESRACLLKEVSAENGQVENSVVRIDGRAERNHTEGVFHGFTRSPLAAGSV